MVYSSDFYTSRRPAYYKPASSYSVTPLYSSDGYDLPPTYYKAHQVYQTCTTPTPFILTPLLSTGKPSPNVLPYNGYPYYHHQYTPLHRRSAAAIHGVLDRIEHRPRSHPSYDPTDEYLNSRSATTFDDVKRDIRAQTAGLLKQVYTPTFRPKISSVSNAYSEMPIVQRIESDAYIEKILSDSDSYRRENNIGKGHLACVSYAGGKAYPRRRPHLSTEVDDNITMLSYYNKTREAAAASSPRPSVKINKVDKQYNKKPSEQNDNESVEAVQLAAVNEAAKQEEARLAAEEENAAILLIAEKEATRLAAEEQEAKIEERRLTLEKEAEEKRRLVAEEERAAQLAGEEEENRLALENEAKEKARLLVEEESAAQLAAEREATRLAAEEKEHRLALEKETEEKAQLLALEKDAEDKVRLAAEEEEYRLALEKEANETARLLALEIESEDAEIPEKVESEITADEIIEVPAVSICELAESTLEDIDALAVKETNNDELDTEPEEVAQAEGQESTEEEYESEDEDE